MAKTKSGRSLTRYVTVINPDDRNDYTFGPDDDVPDWAAELITNEAAFETEDDYVDESTGLPSGALRDAVHNKRGRVRREAPMATGMGERQTPSAQGPFVQVSVDGNVEEVLAAVGEDKAKASAALAAEQAKGEKARSTLVDRLQEIAGGSGA